MSAVFRDRKTLDSVKVSTRQHHGITARRGVGIPLLLLLLLGPLYCFCLLFSFFLHLLSINTLYTGVVPSIIGPEHMGNKSFVHCFLIAGSAQSVCLLTTWRDAKNTINHFIQCVVTMEVLLQRSTDTLV
jgi:hypothetical protein